MRFHVGLFRRPTPQGHTPFASSAMADESSELWAAMGMPMAFGKKAKAKNAGTHNFDQMKRAEVRLKLTEGRTLIDTRTQQPSEPSSSRAVNIQDSNSVIDVPPPSNSEEVAGPSRPVNDDAEDEGEDSGFEEEDARFSGAEFPISHELILKDHTKVSAIPRTDSLTELDRWCRPWL